MSLEILIETGLDGKVYYVAFTLNNSRYRMNEVFRTQNSEHFLLFLQGWTVFGGGTK